MDFPLEFEVRILLPLTVFEQVAFNAETFTGPHDSGHALFSKNFKGMMSVVLSQEHACQV